MTRDLDARRFLDALHELAPLDLKKTPFGVTREIALRVGPEEVMFALAVLAEINFENAADLRAALAVRRAAEPLGFTIVPGPRKLDS